MNDALAAVCRVGALVQFVFAAFVLDGFEPRALMYLSAIYTLVLARDLSSAPKEPQP